MARSPPRRVRFSSYISAQSLADPSISRTRKEGLDEEEVASPFPPDIPPPTLLYTSSPPPSRNSSRTPTRFSVVQKWRSERQKEGKDRDRRIQASSPSSNARSSPAPRQCRWSSIQCKAYARYLLGALCAFDPISKLQETLFPLPLKPKATQLQQHRALSPR